MNNKVIAKFNMAFDEGGFSQNAQYDYKEENNFFYVKSNENKWVKMYSEEFFGFFKVMEA